MLPMQIIDIIKKPTKFFTKLKNNQIKMIHFQLKLVVLIFIPVHFHVNACASQDSTKSKEFCTIEILFALLKESF